MKRLSVIVFGMLILSCATHRSAHQSFREMAQQPLTAARWNASVLCGQTDSGLQVYAEVEAECPSLARVNRAAQAFCWENYTPRHRFKASPCLAGKRLIVTRSLIDCPNPRIQHDGPDASCMVDADTIMVAWTRTTLWPDDTPHHGVGWRVHLWHALCHTKERDDLRHAASCYVEAPLTIDRKASYPYRLRLTNK